MKNLIPVLIVLAAAAAHVVFFWCINSPPPAPTQTLEEFNALEESTYGRLLFTPPPMQPMVEYFAPAKEKETRGDPRNFPAPDTGPAATGGDQRCGACPTGTTYQATYMLDPNPKMTKTHYYDYCRCRPHVDGLERTRGILIRLGNPASHDPYVVDDYQYIDPEVALDALLGDRIGELHPADMVITSPRSPREEPTENPFDRGGASFVGMGLGQ